MDGPEDYLDRKHVFYTSDCMRIMSIRFYQEFIAKLKQFKDAGIDIDELPGDLKMLVIVHMTVDEAMALTQKSPSKVVT